ncbi:DUF393 domain-containing protein [Oceanobacillus piezotolerans]|uniref:DUF393 domain-containing protein n=1 Tax=Oceanobacillus piezotolerans TaxID=2448030 RepID=A0A498D9M6_9BACI|nr:DCC1-like thiol-disulfide oxidoreductase family protein [Oceanobacillus piezotolerans]RLL43630.1 DUF393 domain-containing protein [Oceanobacillus piezotolerans]
MPVLIYDGECNMCSSFIRFVVKINRNPELNITDFHSNWTKENVTLDPNVDSMIFITRDEQYIYSNAVIHLLVTANPRFSALLLLKLIPRSVRDTFYKFVARNRRKVFQNKTCPMPSKKAREMFLS